MKFLQNSKILQNCSQKPLTSSQKPLTSSQIIAARKEPVFDVFIGANGDAAVKVTGVPRPFQFVLPAAILRDASAFGRPSRASVMRVAQGVAREKILNMERGTVHAT